MINKLKIVLLASFISLMTLVSIPSLADPRAIISQSQAIKIAKNYQKGKVVNIKLIKDDGKAFYKIRIVQTVDNKQKIKNVLVDAKTGKVISSGGKN